MSGADAPAPLLLSNCHPTIESDYSLMHIDGVSSPPLQASGGSVYIGFLFGITPILTILRNASISEPEIHLTCLKIITSEGNTSTELTSASTVVAPDSLFAYSALLVLGILSFV